MSPTPLFDEFAKTSLYVDKTIKHLFGPQYIDYLKEWYPAEPVKPDPTTGRLPRIVQKPEPHTTDSTQDWFLRSLDSYPYLLPERGLPFSETKLSRIVDRWSSLPDCDLIEAELKTAVKSCTQPGQLESLRGRIKTTHDRVDDVVSFLIDKEVSKTTSEMSGQYRHDIDLLIDEERSQQKAVWDEQKTYTLTKLKRYSLHPFAQWIDQKTEYLTKLKRASDHIHAVKLLPGKIGYHALILCRLIEDIDQPGEPLATGKGQPKISEDTERKARQAVTLFDNQIDYIVQSEKGKARPMSNEDIVKRGIVKYGEIAVGCNVGRTEKSLNRYLGYIGIQQTVLEYGGQLVGQLRNRNRL